MPETTEAAGVSVEAELIRDTLRGDARAFEEIVRMHTRRIFNFIHQMTRNHQDAEDLTQLTFVKAFQNLHRVDTSRPLVNWLFTIARRSALNHFRSAKRWESISDDTAETSPTPADTAQGQDRIANLWATARRMLSQREYEIMWLRFAEELSVAEVARITGLTQPHIKIIVFRARRHLMKLKDQS